MTDTFRRLESCVEQYGGRVLELRGDALLAEFERASDAATAALAFQSGQPPPAGDSDESIRPQLRIGIAMGEVVIADNTVTGTGVVLAQRIERLAKAGGVCITAAIHEALPQRLPFDQHSLGEQRLQGFDEPVNVYRLSLKPDASLEAQAGSAAAKSSRSRKHLLGGTVLAVCAAALALWLLPWNIIQQPEPTPAVARTIAVLPFDNMSDDPGQQYFSDGISEDIITDLSRLQSLAVIARNSSFAFRDTAVTVQEIGRDLGAQYLLEGSVRRDGNRIRINAQLIETDDGHHLWAERYDRELTDMFALQDEITQKIVSALEIRLSGEDQRRLAHEATSNFEAYDLFLRGQEFRADYSEAGLGSAMEMFRRSIEADPTFARAYGALAIAMMRTVFAGYSSTPAESKNRALELAQKAASLDPESPQVQWALGYVYMYREQFDEAVEALRRSIELSPSYADAYAMLALIRNNQGRGEDAIRLIEKGIALNPHYSWDYLYNLGRAHYLLGNYDQAASKLEQALQRNESPSYPRIFLIASLVRLERLDDAEWEVEQLGMFHPEMTLSHIRQTFPFSTDELKQRLLQELEMAGLGE